MQQEQDLMPIRFVILGTPYTIKPTEELTAEDINELVEYVKSLVESYLRKGFDEQRVPLLVAFHIADEKRRLQEKYELPLYRIAERLQFAIEEEVATEEEIATEEETD
ncbi:MAG: cell division protein ZapA [Candidatus Poribacteria bacterium]|nr:cell division protein ZapA [Candidatus Poribacteria bacterium]